MSHGPPLPTSLTGFDMSMMAGTDMPILQMNPDDPSDTIPLDDSIFDAFDTAMSGTLTADDQQPYASAPHQPSPAGSNEGPSVSSEGNPPRERVGVGTASTLTEFTKRRNWPAKVIEELQDLLHILDANGRIKSVSPSAEHLTGYKPAELRDVFMRDLLHPDDVGVFTSELNESIASGAPLRIFYRLRKKDGNYAVFEAVGHAHIAGAKFAPNPNNQTPFCQAVFMMSRPYPTKKAALLDSFLEHKMENERLMRKIAELQKEIQEDAEQTEMTWQTRSQPVTDSSISPSERRMSLDTEPSPGNTTQHPPPGASHADTIEMLTGLRYQEGERSRGITTGNPSPALITGDAGITIPADREARAGDKKKKVKVTEEYVCTDCGTLESPEWRKGPSGAKTLCNACGLRWAKKEKKKQVQPSGAGGDE